MELLVEATELDSDPTCTLKNPVILIQSYMDVNMS